MALEVFLYQVTDRFEIGEKVTLSAKFRGINSEVMLRHPTFVSVANTLRFRVHLLPINCPNPEFIYNGKPLFETRRL